MGWEYQLNYLSPKSLSEARLNAVKKRLAEATAEELKIELLKVGTGDLEYGLKFNNGVSNEWIWDGQLYLNSDEGTLVFHVKQERYITITKRLLEKIFEEIQMEIKIEEL